MSPAGKSLVDSVAQNAGVNRAPDGERVIGRQHQAGTSAAPTVVAGSSGKNSPTDYSCDARLPRKVVDHRGNPSAGCGDHYARQFRSAKRLIFRGREWGTRRARVLDPGGREWSFGSYRPGTGW